MNTFEEVQALVTENLALIQMDPNAFTQARDRAAKFLVTQAILTSYLKGLQDARPKVQTLVDATYAQAIANSGGKNVTENKITAEADPNYTQYREAVESVDSEIHWVKTHMEIFFNAHLFFRQNSRE